METNFLGTKIFFLGMKINFLGMKKIESRSCPAHPELITYIHKEFVHFIRSLGYKEFANCVNLMNSKRRVFFITVYTSNDH